MCLPFNDDFLPLGLRDLQLRGRQHRPVHGVALLALRVAHDPDHGRPAPRPDLTRGASPGLTR